MDLKFQEQMWSFTWSSLNALLGKVESTSSDEAVPLMMLVCDDHKELGLNSVDGRFRMFEVTDGSQYSRTGTFPCMSIFQYILSE